MRSADGSINADSDVDTGDDNVDSNIEPDGSFAVGPAGTSLFRIGGRKSRFIGHDTPASASTATRGLVIGSTRHGRPEGMVGHVRRIFTGSRCSQVEVGGPLTLRPPPPRPPAATRRRVGVHRIASQAGCHLLIGAAP